MRTNSLRLAAALWTAAVLCHPLWAAAPKAKPAANEPSPQTRTFFISGVKSEADVKAVTASVLKVQTVTKVEGLTPDSGFANITFDHHGVTHQRIAQGIADAGPFQVTFRFALPEYAANKEKIDEIFAKVQDAAKIELADKEKSEFVLTFLPLKEGENGFNFGRIGHPISDPPPSGLGLKFVAINAGSAKPTAKAPAKQPAKSTSPKR